MNSILDTHAPLKKVNKYKLKFKTKLWNSIKNTWKGIKSIITIKDILADIPKSISVDCVTISNPLAISDIFNNYFSSTADKTKLDISFSHKYFSDFLENRSHIFFFISPTDKTEIENITSSF